MGMFLNVVQLSLHSKLWPCDHNIAGTPQGHFFKLSTNADSESKINEFGFEWLELQVTVSLQNKHSFPNEKFMQIVARSQTNV